MAEKVITSLSFVGEGHAGRLAYPGEVVDVDAKGVLVPAGSTPIGNMTTEQLEAELARRNGEEADAEPVFGSNVADLSDTNTGSQPLVMAPFRPGSGPIPQGIPPGTVPHGDSFIRPASEEAHAAVETVVGAAAVEGGVRTDVALEDQTIDPAAGAGSDKAPTKKK
jgi:hypothetical protein